MPWTQHWFDAPKDMSLTVHKELPEGITEGAPFTFAGVKEATGYVDKGYKTFHFCDRCGGWIEGYANQFEVNNLNSNMLAGRKGTEYFCRRCGTEIGFFGLMS